MAAEVEYISQIVSSVRAAFATGKTLPLSFRREQLKNLLRMFEECTQEIIDALHADMRKPELEIQFVEIEPLKVELRHTLAHLEEWMKPERVPTNLFTISDSAYIKKDPFGVVLILAPWNYPFNLAFWPLIGAIAAGNCAVIKPSEVSAASSATIARIVPRYLDNSCYKVFEGDVNATIELLDEKFDYILATGSCGVGKSVMAAAAKNLTPVTLELGGKSPVYIDDAVSMDRIIKRIIWGKLINAGQTCVAPDYILISKKRQKEFLDAASQVIAEWTQKGSNSDLARIITKRHFQRLKKIIDTTKGRIVFGGETDEKNLWISPAVIADVDPVSDSTMQDEIFGPVLPIINVESPEVAIKFIRERPKPLVVHVFSEDDATIQKFVNGTSSGGVVVNDIFLHMGWQGLPLGGVGPSGLGQYHGKFTVDTFSHKKAVLHRSLNFICEKAFEFRYPPYGPKKLKMLFTAFAIFPNFYLKFNSFTTHATAAIVGAAVAAAAFFAWT